MAVVIPTIKQCRFCAWWTREPGYRVMGICKPEGRAYDVQMCGARVTCSSFQSGGLLPEAYVDANAQEVDDAEYVSEWWQTGEAGVVTAQLVRRGIRRVRMAVRWVDAS